MEQKSVKHKKFKTIETSKEDEEKQHQFQPNSPQETESSVLSFPVLFKGGFQSAKISSSPSSNPPKKPIFGFSSKNSSQNTSVQSINKSNEDKEPSSSPQNTIVESEEPAQQISEVVPQIPYLVIDVSNVCYLHGKNDKFSPYGLQLAVQHFGKTHRIVAFLPDYMIENHYPDPNEDWTIVDLLHKAGVLKSTPGSEYDDITIIKYAIQHQAFILSNDRFKDLPRLLLPNETSEKRERLAKWIDSHTIKFYFPDVETFAVKTKKRKKPSS